MDVTERGDLVTINLNPQAGHEQAGVCPCIVLSPRIDRVCCSLPHHQ